MNAAVTGCMVCGDPIPPDGPTDLFCSAVCNPTRVNQQEWDGGTTAAQIAKRRRSRRTPKPAPAGGGARLIGTMVDEVVNAWQSYQVDREWVRSYLNHPTPATTESPRRMEINVDGRWREIPGAVDIRIEPDHRRDAERHHLNAARTSWRSIAPAPTIDPGAVRAAFAPLVDAIASLSQRLTPLHESAPPIAATADDAPKPNKHLHLAADDPRREILARVQNRNTGPAATPFKNRGRR